MRARGRAVILYRAQASSGDSWATEWSSNQADAKKLAKALVSAGYHSPHVDRIEIGADRDSIVAALNHATVHRINWDGEEIKL